MADVDLQDEPLQVKVMDYDTYSANDLIGKVYFNLNPLLLGSNAEIRSAFKPIQPAPGMLSGRNKAPKIKRSAIFNLFETLWTISSLNLSPTQHNLAVS